MRPTARTLLASSDVPALLVSNLINIRYLTGVSLSAGLLLVQPRRMTLFVDARYSEKAAHAAFEDVTVADSADIQKALRSVPHCGLEADDVTLTRMQRWKRSMKNTKFVQTSGLVEGFRRRKSPDEISRMQRARTIAWEIVRRVPGVLRAGITERQLAWRFEEWSRELGAERLSFDPIVAFGTHSSRPHHAPTTRALKKGHLVQVDLGVVYKGYCSDVSDVFFTAKPTGPQAKAIAAVRDAKERATAAIKPGITATAVDAIARAALAEAGIEAAFTHALGHGVGLEVHEGITLSSRAGTEKLLRHEVVTVEPGVYFPGKFGIRLEDMVFVP